MTAWIGANDSKEQQTALIPGLHVSSMDAGWQI